MKLTDPEMAGPVPRVLIVDDEKSIRVTLSEFLRNEGYEVEMAEEVESALLFLKEQPFDVIISDIILPRITGVELLQKVREAYPETQVIMITGEPTVDTAAKALRIGACDYLFKPVSKEAVIKTVANAMRIRTLEKANRYYRENLENMVEERTRELNHALKEKDQMQKKIIQQERLTALGRVASGIAHDINNTLSPITLYTETLLERKKNLCTESKRYITLIQKAAYDIEATIMRLREFYRGSEPGAAEFDSIPISDVLTHAIDLSQPRCSDVEKKMNINIEIEQEIEEGLPPVLGVESEISEALVNLLYNAFDAMRESGSIYVRASYSNSHIAIEVADPGIGMDEEQREHCFDPFYTTKGNEGTGLGLSSVYGIVERHGGKLEVQSRPGEGSTVRLYLQSGDSTSDSSLKTAGPLEIPPLHILIIDDDPVVQGCLQDVLEQQGHTIVTASSGEEGIDFFLSAISDTNQLDIVITDLGMPGMNGKCVAEKIKTIDRNMPVVLLSGWGNLARENIKEDPNIDAVLGKPPKISEINKTLDTLIRQEQFNRHRNG